MAQGKKNIPTIEPTESDKAYAAGFIDADGCITVRMNTAGTARARNVARTCFASITASQTKVPPLLFLRDRWGGSLRQLPARKGNSSPAWEWVAVSQMAYKMLDDIRPYLLIKGDRADNALSLRDIRSGSGRGHALTTDELAQHRAAKETSMELNKRGAI